MPDEVCSTEGRDKKAVVGWGRDPVWLCAEHFGERLKGVRAIANLARKAGRKRVRQVS